MSNICSNFAHRMENNKQIKIRSESIFATGVYLQPCEIEINGKKQWRWIAIGFEDDSFQNGQPIEINEYASTLYDLYKSSQ